MWVIYDKKVDAAPQRLSYADIVEEALCFGWIDSLPRRISAEQTGLLLTPRQPKSGWSKLNKTRIESLVKRGLMQPAGQARIDAAKRNGSWTLLDEVEWRCPTICKLRWPPRPARPSGSPRCRPPLAKPLCSRSAAPNDPKPAPGAWRMP